MSPPRSGPGARPGSLLQIGLDRNRDGDLGAQRLPEHGGAGHAEVGLQDRGRGLPARELRAPHPGAEPVRGDSAAELCEPGRRVATDVIVCRLLDQGLELVRAHCFRSASIEIETATSEPSAFPSMAGRVTPKEAFRIVVEASQPESCAPLIPGPNPSSVTLSTTSLEIPLIVRFPVTS